MRTLKNIFNFYLHGFANMTTGKYLWRIILIKLFIILVVLNYFVYDKSFKTELQTEEQRAAFVYENLKGE